MYAQRHEIYDDIFSFKNYEQEARLLLDIVSKLKPGVQSLLDVACGTGRHLEYLTSQMTVSGLDINPELLSIARRRLPSVDFFQADMTEFALGRRFDVVTCIFGSTSYLLSRESLVKAICAMSEHLVADGILFIEPWLTPEQYWQKNIKLDVSEQPNRKIARMYVGRVDGNLVTNEQHFLIGEPEGVTHFTETHVQALFSRDDYLAGFDAAGLKLSSFDPKGLHGYGLYVLQKPAI